MKTINFSNSKYKEHSKTKTCCCGRHNSSNPKSNKLYHNTKMKLLIKQTRKFIKGSK